MNLVDHKVKKNNVPMLSLSDIETIAEDVLRNFQMTENCDATAVNVERLAEKHLGLRIDYAHLSNNGSILGMIIFQDCSVPLFVPDEKTVKFFGAKAGTVMIDHDLATEGQQGRTRFTIAHECAHWILHRCTRLTYQNQLASDSQIPQLTDEYAIVCRKANNQPNITGVRTPGEWKEWQADNLASALLMPAGAVRQFIYDLTHQMFANHSLSYDLFGERYVQAKIISMIRQMAIAFQVSDKAAEIRLNRLGLIVQRVDIPCQLPIVSFEDTVPAFCEW